MQSTRSEQLPVRGNNTVEILVNDHKIIKNLLSELTHAQETQERKVCLEKLKSALTIHNATEENLVYPALDKVAGQKSESQHLYHETADADVVVFELDTMLKEGRDEAFTAKAEQLQKAVLEHIDDEENKAFPHLQDGAEPRQEQMLTESVRQFRGSIHFEPVESSR